MHDGIRRRGRTVLVLTSADVLDLLADAAEPIATDDRVGDVPRVVVEEGECGRVNCGGGPCRNALNLAVKKGEIGDSFAEADSNHSNASQPRARGLACRAKGGAKRSLCARTSRHSRDARQQQAFRVWVGCVPLTDTSSLT